MGKQSKTIRNKRKIKVENYENAYVDNSIEKKVSKAFTREAQFTIVSIFLVTIVMISSAYAIFSSVQKQETYNTLTVGTLKIDFDQSSTDMGNIINLNGAYPTSDTEGQKTSPYSFKITNSGTLDAYYKVKIIDDTDIITEDGCSNNLLPKDKIKVSINGGTPFLLNSKEANSYIVNDGTLAASESRTFEIRIWIDETAGNEVLGKHYHGKIVVEGENKKVNKNIEIAYIYNETDSDIKCINGEENTCQITKCYTDLTENSCPQGTIIKYKVNNTESKYFYVLHDDGNTITMQQRENTVKNIAWYNEQNYRYGPITILPLLETTTSTWVNVNEQNYTMGTTKIYDNIYTGCYETTDYKLVCNTNSYTLTSRIVKARMITAQEAISTGCLVYRDDGKNNNNFGTCPDWMHNYLYQSTNYGGSYEDNTINVNGRSNIGYWTMNARSSSAYNAWGIQTFGALNPFVATNDESYGARAVVEINK